MDNTTFNFFDHLRPATLVLLIAEMLNDHAEESSTGDFTFTSEVAREAYNDMVAAGRRNMPDHEFFSLLTAALEELEQ